MYKIIEIFKISCWMIYYSEIRAQWSYLNIVRKGYLAKNNISGKERSGVQF